MNNNQDFQNKKEILDELYKSGLITHLEWYESLSKLLAQYDLEKEINSV
jgi:hypothetical protein